MIILTLFISILYTSLILWVLISFNKVQVPKKANKAPKTRFSIIIPFRNEEDNLNSLLNSLFLLEYPRDLFEVLLIDDDSSDASAAIIKRFNDYRSEIKIKLLNTIRRSNSPKKDAITTGIEHARFNWIITTDADCSVPEKWLVSYDNTIQKSPADFIVGPVCYESNQRLIEQFQSFDFLSLQAATIAGFGADKPFLCNGANLCYNKHTFLKLKGFEGNDDIASGDDIFLMEKMISNFRKLVYLKSVDALISTKPQPSVKALISQRIRWASKMTLSKNVITKIIGALVFFINTAIVLLFFTTLFGFTDPKSLLFLFLTKLLMDFILLLKIHRFYDQSFSMSYYLMSSFLYPFFSMFVVIASLIGGFNWKGRSFKK